MTHRDHETSNIMLTASGVKLWTSARRSSRTAKTMSHAERRQRVGTDPRGGALGMLPDMAPEQIEGRDADERTDVFASGSCSSKL